MRAVFGLVLLVGLGLAGFAVYTVKGYFDEQKILMDQQAAVAAQAVPTVEVLAVNRSIGYGETLMPEDVIIIRYAEPFLPEGVFRTGEELFPNQNEEPRLVVRQMEPNEPVLAIKVTEPGESAGLNSRLTPGMQAYAIDVNVRSAVSGFLRPGDRIDVYWTGDVSQFGLNGTGGITTKLIQSGLTIVAVDQNTDSGRSAVSDRVRTVTVEATTAQVAALATAQRSGELSLALVGQGDTVVSTAVEVDQATLLGIAPQVQQAAPEQEQVCTIRTRRGAEVVEIPIPCTN
ncbi:Flp pilus assembly protein CpaB [Marivivens marinus]|uniref:Flp pilus assembly protein CpaB n=1 Tax=Marivivens marinus TaxID=3110173 RepID=UPI003B848B77